MRVLLVGGGTGGGGVLPVACTVLPISVTSGPLVVWAQHQAGCVVSTTSSASGPAAAAIFSRVGLSSRAGPKSQR